MLVRSVGRVGCLSPDVDKARRGACRDIQRPGLPLQGSRAVVVRMSAGQRFTAHITPFLLRSNVLGESA